MQVARRKRSDKARCATLDGQSVDARTTILLGAVADGDRLAIERENVVVVAVARELGIDEFGLAGLVGEIR